MLHIIQVAAYVKNRVAFCNAECPDLQQLVLSQEKIMAIFLKAETHVIILHTTRKFITATPTSIKKDNKNLKVLMIYTIVQSSMNRSS